MWPRFTFGRNAFHLAFLQTRRPAQMELRAIPDGMSIAGLVCGISGLTLIGCGIGLIPAILGVVFGVLGIKKVDASGGAIKGRGMALAGAICGAVAVGLFLIWLALALFGVFNSDSSSY